MSWEERLRPASFRGAPFHVKDRIRSGGRRGPTHEFPQEELPDGQDTGRRARQMKVEGLILGPDYMSARDLLLAALDQAGPGLYVDPWQGEWKVIARRHSCVESDRTGGQARFSIEFEEAGDERYPTALIDTAGGVARSAASLADAAAADFGRVFNVDKRPEFVATDAQTIATTAGQAILDAVSRLPALDLTAGLGAVDAGGSARKFISGAANAVRGDLGGSLKNLFSDAASGVYVAGPPAAGDPVAAGRLFEGFAAFGADLAPVPETTATRRVQAGNRHALSVLVRRLAVAHRAAASAATTFESADGAIAARTALGVVIDALAAEAGGDNPQRVYDDDSFAALGVLRADVNRDLGERAARLPRIRRVTIATPLPAVVVAHRLYGDARRADELVARNPMVTHPGFFPDGVDLEVLGR